MARGKKRVRSSDKDKPKKQEQDKQDSNKQLLESIKHWT